MENKLTCKMSDGTEWELCSSVAYENHAEVRAFLAKPIKREPREFRIEIDSITGNIIGCGYYTSTPGGSLVGREIIKVREVVE